MNRREFFKFAGLSALLTTLPINLQGSTVETDYMYYKLNASKLNFIEYFKISNKDLETFKTALRDYKEFNKNESTFSGVWSKTPIDGKEPTVILSHNLLGGEVRHMNISKETGEDITIL